MRDDLPTGTVTFLFTDVEGSTRLLKEIGPQAYAEALAEHRLIVREACARESGVEVDTQGDAFFFAFPTASGALAAAQVFTDALSPGPIQVRVGLHTGTPIVTDEGYVGSDIHRASRIAAAGHGGQVLVSSTTAPLAELELNDLGEHRLKDLAAPERVYQLGQHDFPPLKSLYRSNLPVPPTAFLGREREMAAVTELLCREGVRLVTLTGPGGTGKTRLALQATAAVSERFPDGLFWVPLAPLRDPALVLVSAAEAMGIKEQAGRSVLESLVLELAGGRVVLLLDNAEHLLPELASDLSALLATAPTLTLVVTSRERLRIEGEHAYPVSALSDEDGMSLFLNRARALDPTFSASDAVPELCERLDHLPLALELAAAHTVLLSPDQLLERLGGRLDLLKGGRDADPRQQTLRATMEWSYDLLSAEEREAFARLSVFSGGCAVAAAETICATDLEVLESLLDKSLVRRRDTGSGPRLWMLETIRQFAAERLIDSGAADEVARRHLDYYLALARDVSERGDEDVYDLDRIEEERDNLRVALDAALAVDPDQAVSLAGWLGPYWGMRSQYREGRERLETALAAAPSAPAPTRALALHAAGSLARFQSDFDTAERLGREALALDTEEGDTRSVGRDLNLLGSIALFRGDLAEATRLLEDSLTKDRLAGGRTRVPDAMFHLMGLAYSSGDYPRAIELARELEASSRGRDNHGRAYALNLLGLSLEASGNTEEARQSFEESIAVCRTHGYPESQAYALASLAHLEQTTRPSHALLHYQESLGLMYELWEQRGIAYCLEGLAAIILTASATQAATLLGAAAVIRERTGAALTPNEQVEVDATISGASEALGVDAHDAAWSAGSRMGLDQAVEYALR